MAGRRGLQYRHDQVQGEADLPERTVAVGRPAWQGQAGARRTAAGGAARGTPECAGVPQVESVGPSLPTRECSAVFRFCGLVYDDPFPHHYFSLRWPVTSPNARKGR